MANIYGFKLINFSYSSYSFNKDHEFQRQSQKSYYDEKKFILSLGKLKKILKKIIPKKLISMRQDFLHLKNFRSDTKLNWFINNTGDNCYIRGVLKKTN